jgi:hypothetical protein
MQEVSHKDIERAFIVLQARFANVRGPTKFWDKRTLRNIIVARVIMHNMVMEDDRDMELPFKFDNVKDFLDIHKKIEHSDKHTQLREDLVQYL